MTRVLLVDDDPAIRQALSLSLRRAGHEVVVASTGEEALRIQARERAEIILLDVMLPGIDGFDVCRSIRSAGGPPVIMLTARDDAVDVIVGLEVGADDYVTKPVEPRVLAARIKAVLRRATPTVSRPVRLGPLLVDREAMIVTRDGEELALTPTEMRLLLELVANPRRALTRETLLRRVWDYDHLGDSRLVDAAVQRLRAKIEPDPSSPTLIRTIRGSGYRLDPPAEIG